MYKRKSQNEDSREAKGGLGVYTGEQGGLMPSKKLRGKGKPARISWPALPAPVSNLDDIFGFESEWKGHLRERMRVVMQAQMEKTTVQTLALTGRDIAELVFHLLDYEPNSQAQVEVTFRAPMGGDWSGEEIDICEETPVTVTITRTEREGAK